MTSRPPCTGAALLRPPRGCAPRPRCCAPTAPPSRPLYGRRAAAPLRRSAAAPLRRRHPAPCTGAALLRPYGAALLRPYGAALLRPYGAALLRPYGAALLRPYGAALLRPYGAAIPPPCMGAALLRPYVRPYGAGPNSARRSGSAKTCIGGADATTRPSCITTTVSAHCRATVRSWVASSTVTPCSTSRSKIAKI
jgi:hypothetical protein